MKALATTQVTEWLARHGIRTTSDAYPISISEEDELRFRIPSDAGRRIALAGKLYSPFRGKTVLLWYREWGVWPSGERRHLFDRFLASYGLSADLQMYPGFELDPADQDVGESLLCFGILFLWDVFVVEADKTNSVYLSHHELGWCFSTTGTHLLEIRSMTEQ